MTVAAIIEQIRALPPEEQSVVLDFLEELKTGRASKEIRAEEFEKCAGQVFDRHSELMRKLSQ
jgi:hypothetical protein